MEVMKELAEYYGNYDEDNRLRSRHGMVEFLTTMRYVDTHHYGSRTRCHCRHVLGHW